MKIPPIMAAAAALALSAPAAQATAISGAYTSLGGNAWLASFTVTNDGTPASFAGFSIDIPNATGLTLVASPSTWDSAVFQPAPGLPDAGFLDSFVRNPANALGVGQSIGGFDVSFAFTAGATPGALPFVVYGANFTPLFVGTTTAGSSANVPEPGTAWLAGLGLAIAGLGAARKQVRAAGATGEVRA